MDTTEFGAHNAAHHHDMPEWGRILWNRHWTQQAQIDHLAHVIKENRMATQADLDALTASLTAADQGIQAEIAALQAANPTLDLSGLTAAVAATAALVPAPAPAPSPTPAPPAA